MSRPSPISSPRDKTQEGVPNIDMQDLEGFPDAEEPLDITKLPRNARGLLRPWLLKCNLTDFYQDMRQLFNGQDTVDGVFAVDDRELEGMGMSDSQKKAFFLNVVDTKFAEISGGQPGQGKLWPQEFYNEDTIFDHSYALREEYIDSVTRYGRSNVKGSGQKGDTSFGYLGQQHINDPVAHNMAGKEQMRHMEESAQTVEWRKKTIMDLDKRAREVHGHDVSADAMSETLVEDLLRPDEKIVNEITALGYANPQKASIGTVKLVLTECRTEAGTHLDETTHGNYSRNFTPYHRLFILIEAHSAQVDGKESKSMWDILCFCKMASQGQHNFSFHEHRETDVSFACFNLENTLVQVKALAHHATDLTHQWGDQYKKEYSYEVQVVDNAEGSRATIYDSRKAVYKNVSVHTGDGLQENEHLNRDDGTMVGRRGVGGRQGDYGDGASLNGKKKNACIQCCKFFLCCSCLPCGKANEGTFDFEIYGSTKSKQLRELAVKRFEDKSYKGAAVPSLEAQVSGSASPRSKERENVTLIHELGATSRFHSIEMIMANPVTNELELHSFMIDPVHTFTEIFKFCSLAQSHIPASTIPECSPGVQNRLRAASTVVPITDKPKGGMCNIM